MPEGSFTRLPPRRDPIPTRAVEPEAATPPAEPDPSAAPAAPHREPRLRAAWEEARASFAAALRAGFDAHAATVGAVVLLVALAGRFLGLGALVGSPGSVPPSSPAEAERAIAVLLAYLAPLPALLAGVTLGVEGDTRAVRAGALTGRALALGLAAFAAAALAMLLPLDPTTPPPTDALLMGLYAGLHAATWLLLGALLCVGLGRLAALAGLLVWMLFYPWWGFLQPALGLAGTALNPNLLFLAAVQQGLEASRATLARLTPGLDPAWAFRLELLWAALAGAGAVVLRGRRRP